MVSGGHWLDVACPSCGQAAGRHCKTRTGRIAEEPHVARLAAAAPVPTADEIAERDRRDREYAARRAMKVRTTFVLTCGCVEPTSEPIPMREWPVTDPGAVAICERHREYAVVVEVRTRMVADVPSLARLYRAAGFDELDAEGLAEAQADDEP